MQTITATTKTLRRKSGTLLKLIRRFLRRCRTPDAELETYPSLNDFGQERLEVLCRLLLERTQGKVFAGPFAEMRLVPGCHLTTRPLWIVGCYEKEIHDSLNYVISRAPRRVIDIGSGYGYYLVGMALHLPEAVVVGFEARSEGHWEQALQLARANQVEGRVVQKGKCTVAELRGECIQDSFVLCDCEGAELELLDPVQVPSLRSCMVVCELHDCIVPGLTGRVVSRFKESHEISILPELPRQPDEYRILRRLTRWQREVSVMETRNVDGVLTSARFMVLKPRPAFSRFWNGVQGQSSWPISQSGGDGGRLAP